MMLLHGGKPQALRLPLPQHQHQLVLLAQGLAQLGEGRRPQLLPEAQDLVEHLRQARP